MKKLFVVFGILVALFALFAISSSAAILRDTQYTFLSVPAHRNIAQPIYGRNSNAGYAQWSQSAVPSNAARSAFGGASSFFTPDNNQYTTQSSVTNWNNDGTPIYVLYSYGDVCNVVNQGAPASFMHLIFDLGASSGSYSTSPIVADNIVVRVGLGENMVQYRPSKLADKNVIYFDIPIPAGGGIPVFDVIFLRPSNLTNADVLSLTCFVNNVYLFIDDASVYPFIDSTLLDEPCGYTNAYLQYLNQPYMNDATSTSDNQYWFDLGFATAEDTAYQNGFNGGWDAGVASVTEQSGDPVSIKTAIFAVPNALVHLLRSLFNFEIAGFNLFDAFKFLLALLATAFVARIVLRSMT